MKRLMMFVSLMLLMSQPLMAVRVKDLVEIQGVRENKLTGYGLVVGLNGTGDKSGADFTVVAMANMLKNIGVQVNPGALKPKNVAAVMVTASLPPFARSGQKMDVTVSSVGDATSLNGGTLITAPLYGPDGKVYALAQGAVSVGGFAVEGQSGSNVTKNFPTVGRIPDGSVVERSLNTSLGDNLTLVLTNPDFTTANRLVASVNRHFGSPVAQAEDLSTVRVRLPGAYSEKLVDFVAQLEAIEVNPDNYARVVVNERTGTVVMGSNVKIATVAIAHGNLSIRISETPQVSQPGALAGGTTAVTAGTSMQVAEGGKGLVVLPSGTTIGEMVGALNAIGVTPRDLVIILQSIKRSGALYADLEVI